MSPGRCGRCLPACPLGLIAARSYVWSPAEVMVLLWSNSGQTVVEKWSNSGKKAVKQWPNSGQTAATSGPPPR